MRNLGIPSPGRGIKWGLPREFCGSYEKFLIFSCKNFFRFFFLICSKFLILTISLIHTSKPHFSIPVYDTSPRVQNTVWIVLQYFISIFWRILKTRKSLPITEKTTLVSFLLVRFPPPVATECLACIEWTILSRRSIALRWILEKFSI